MEEYTCENFIEIQLINKTQFSGKTISLKRVKEISVSCDESFQGAIGSVLAFAQFFGVMPVIGVKTNCASKLQFKWNSRRTIYCIFVFILVAGYAGLNILILWKNGIQFDVMSKN